ncbi:MAG: sigma-70 family RNA polymerase sigma factor [Lachnospiraceae bacterium]|nr:sigma-70 family RNA polymerase sigma factor [Lachnospiraceae bacterium]
MLPEKEKRWYTEQILACQTGLYRLAFGILRNEEDACDALQEALCIGYEKLADLRQRSRFRPWMMKITANAAYDILRKRPNLVDLEEIGELPEPRPGVSQTESMSLKEAVDSLPEEYRIVVLLFYYEDMPVRQISDITGVSNDLVRTRLSRARQMLRKIWKE